jgi:hypothetical protein
MSRAIVLEALWRVTIWGITGRGNRLRRAGEAAILARARQSARKSGT